MPVTIRAAGIRVTNGAIQIDLDGERHWLPKSQILSIDGIPANFFDNGLFETEDLLDFSITDWIAAQKGFTLVEEVFVASTQTGTFTGPLHSIRMNGQVVGYAPDQKCALMIAAALNMTIGKV